MGQRIKNPDDVLAARALARLMLGRVQEAFADASEALRLQPNAPHVRLRQRTALAARRFDMLQLDRPDEVKRLPLGGQRLRIDLRAAAEGLERLARTQKDEAFRASLAEAVILSALGDQNAAVAVATRAINLSPYSPRAFLIRAAPAALWRRCLRSW